MKEAVNLDQIKTQVVDQVSSAFDASDRNYDANAILIPIRNALDRITIARVQLDLEKYLALLDKQLSSVDGNLYENGAVKNEAIPQLKKVQISILGRMTDDVCKTINEQGVIISRELETQAGIFIDEITKKLAGNHQKVESMIADKENNLQKLEDFIKIINSAKEKIQESDR